MLPTGRCHATKGRAAAAAMRSVATVTVQIVVTACWLAGCSGWRSGRWRRQAHAHVVHASPDARARERVPLQPLPDAPPAHRGDPTWPFVYCCVPVGQRGVLWSACLSVCLSVCVSIYPRNYSPIFTKFFVHVTYGRGSVVLWRRNDTLRISGFWGWRHRLIVCSTSPPGWGSQAHMYAVFSLARRNTRCRQRTLGTTSCSQGLLGHSGRVEYLWRHACT